MTKNDFFIVMVKLFGLYSLFTTLFYVAPNYYTLFITGPRWEAVAISFFAIILPILIFTWIIIKAPAIAKWLKLNRGFEQNEIEVDK
jgi:hypothetical protein